MPLIQADIPAVLDLDQRCLGGLWTHSGYQRELESEQSDLLVLITGEGNALSAQKMLQKRFQQAENLASENLTAGDLAAENLAAENLAADAQPLRLLGIGCLWAILEEAHLTTLAIEPNCQRQKLGQFLLAELLLQGHQRGLTHATLEVRVSNESALRLYQKFGFKEAGQRKRYYSDGENARILWQSGLQNELYVAQIHQHRQTAIAQISEQYSIYEASCEEKPDSL
ncbi:MAG: ribosomal-protein-alanine acetyltransferase [Phormidesmis priestleyi Ana]|uniref:Ribosomal-protein-alanine acetyltransferase n=1 Tax=Phormidesmis priestleyi Ana TaxID=1666911 RepID=A0A0P8BSU6_9CYAN|nr:MAG: ribosomal-protein-alanine acetyltransferase [Phormidesmis priestleyi Ana]